MYEGRLHQGGQWQQVALKRLDFDAHHISLEGAIHQIIQDLPDRRSLIVRLHGFRVMDMPCPAYEEMADQLMLLRAREKQLMGKEAAGGGVATVLLAIVQQKIKKLREEMSWGWTNGEHVAPAFVLVLGFVSGCRTLSQAVAGNKGLPLVSTLVADKVKAPISIIWYVATVQSAGVHCYNSC